MKELASQDSTLCEAHKALETAEITSTPSWMRLSIFISGIRYDFDVKAEYCPFSTIPRSPLKNAGPCDDITVHCFERLIHAAVVLCSRLQMRSFEQISRESDIIVSRRDYPLDPPELESALLTVCRMPGKRAFNLDFHVGTERYRYRIEVRDCRGEQFQAHAPVSDASPPSVEHQHIEQMLLNSAAEFIHMLHRRKIVAASENTEPNKALL
jgi:hypothetical protein